MAGDAIPTRTLVIATVTRAPEQVTDGEVAGLRAAMQRLMADPALGRRLGEAGRRRVERETNQVRDVAQRAEAAG